MHLSSGSRGPRAPKQPWNFKGSLNLIICAWQSRLTPGCSMCFTVALGSSHAPSAEGNVYTTSMPGGASPCREISVCPFFGSFWLVFSEGLWGSWKPLRLKLEILETLFLFISVWLISIYNLCNVLPCGSLEFGMWTCPLFPGRKRFLPAQCREVTLACSGQSLRNSFNREKTWHITE